MDDDNGLELSLGLSCGGGKGKGNNAGTSSENHNLEGGGDRSAKVIDDFKNFLHPTTSQRPAAEQSSEPPPQNFFNDLSKAPTADAEASTKPLWVEDKAMKEAGSSKIKEEARVDMHEMKKKTKASYVSNATDEGSKADNEDVAECEAGGGDGGGSSSKKKINVRKHRLNCSTFGCLTPPKMIDSFNKIKTFDLRSVGGAQSSNAPK